jgi:uncharacterized protein with FMN-binding domain
MAPSDRPKNNLLALGSAAVIAVYAAGYVRTKPAAAKLAEDTEARRRRQPAEERSVAPLVKAPSVKPLADSAKKTTIPQKVAAATKPRTAKSDAQKLMDDPESAKAESLAIAAAREEKERPTKFVVPPLNYVPPTQQAAASVPEPLTAADSAKPGFPPWRDGTFFGWGTSRHGDIKVGIEIRGGAIARAFISECHTRYSCSWVAHLPRQVVDRQSPNTDFVTSATESANAFYYGVVEALKLAK